MRLTLAAFGAAAIIVTTFAAPQAEARFYSPGLSAPDLVEPVACRVTRERVVRPNGRVIFRTRRVCDRLGVRGPCRVVKERTVRPNGRVVVRTIRRCGV